MAKRKIGDAIIRIKYLDSNEYAGTITAYGKIWKFENLFPPRCGFSFGYDSPEAYDEMAQSAASFGSYFTSNNRKNTPKEELESYPDAETADAIDQATGMVLQDNGKYEIERIR